MRWEERGGRWIGWVGLTAGGNVDGRFMLVGLLDLSGKMEVEVERSG